MPKRHIAALLHVLRRVENCASGEEEIVQGGHRLFLLAARHD
jgi:hypothetical protein